MVRLYAVPKMTVTAVRIPNSCSEMGNVISNMFGNSYVDYASRSNRGSTKETGGASTLPPSGLNDVWEKL